MAISYTPPSSGGGEVPPDLLARLEALEAETGSTAIEVSPVEPADPSVMIWVKTPA